MACYLSVSAIPPAESLVGKLQWERQPLTIDIPVDVDKIGRKADDG